MDWFSPAEIIDNGSAVDSTGKDDIWGEDDFGVEIWVADIDRVDSAVHAILPVEVFTEEN